MVMDSKPSVQGHSPQNVGREFVRQYYTLLNQAPLHLHRFYSANSSFVHGGLDSNDKASEPANGQREIHQRIQQLNFNDCKAKIRQVDAHATLGSGVVVQVSGELSNRRQPMRRFMQTFVLAPQSPKKYYVINDIFRYQDEVFSDDEQEGEAAPTTVLESTEGPDVVAENIKNAAEVGVNNNVQKFATQPNVGVGGDGITTVSINAVAADAEHPPPDVVKPKVAEIPVNGGRDESEDGDRSQSESVTSPPPPPPAQPVDEDVGGAESVASNDEESGKPAESSGPLSYANLVKSTPAGATVAVSPGSLPSSGFGKSPQSASSGGGREVNSKEGTPSPGFTGPGSTGGGKFRPGRGGGGPRAQGANARGYSTSSSRGGEEDVQREGRGGPRSGGSNATTLYPDSQQVFVGNLPHNCSEPDLEQLFGQFGKVVEIRISVKGVQQSKVMPSGQKVPNFGFVVFETEEEAKECLSKVPIHLPDGHRLNVETKKNKQMRSDLQFSTGGGNQMKNRNSNASGGSNFGSQEQLGSRPSNSWSRSGSRGGGGSRGGSRGGGTFSGSGRGSGGPPGSNQQQGPSGRGAYSGSRRT